MTQPDAIRSLVDDDSVRITYYEWTAPDPRGVVHIAHGAGEHARRYGALAGELVAAGYTVVADDHRGHGQTGLDYLGLGHLGPHGIRGATSAVQKVGESLRERHPDLPLFLLGHSWGSLMAQKIVARTDLYDGVVLTGTSLAVIGVLNGGDLNKPWRGTGATGLEWLSRDEAVGAAFTADPLCFDIAEKPVWTLPQSLQFLGRPPRHLPRDLPVLIMAGSDDTLGSGRGARLLADAYRDRAGLSDVEVEIYPGARHEVFNETNRDEVIARLVDWLGRHSTRR
ncbi:Lysophospholipase, alpha-beta hydrolase superfamily [Paramicrobacterium humi]|uniref:Lysophospholipase, alpha-beta hydrolase superfamily n=1 Tax=Paramicrobacterium humi TaxID=640635 RepID=A0A1H4JGK4_9MICO|nr:alpha/beta hydrolase [Microbacterium humi]SEB45403.1 Lysophospholipase, alpha-beta hydrolase superfamily [Microbacterium humi]